MPDRGHYQRLRPVIAGVAQAGVDPVVFGHERMRPDVERLGGRFVDLFSRYPLEAADDESWPVAVRYVTFGATYGEAVARDVRDAGASIVVHDTFAFVGRVVAHRLGLPRVNVCAGHNVVPDRYIPIVATHPRLHVSARCAEAIARLRQENGMGDVSPFSYLANLSPDLNLYCEPPEFFEAAYRSVFEPVAFFGSILDDDLAEAGTTGATYFGQPRHRGLNVYVSFGTVIPPYRPDEVRAAFEAVAAATRRHAGMQVVITCAGVQLPPAVLAGLAGPGVRVEAHVDQWRALRDADVFVTHHGLNSTHESVFSRVPMFSCPFFWDQPAQAVACQRLGLAVPLAQAPLAPVSVDDVERAVGEWLARRDEIAANLERARGWEDAVIAARPIVLRRLRDLC